MQISTELGGMFLIDSNTHFRFCPVLSNSQKWPVLAFRLLTDSHQLIILLKDVNKLVSVSFVFLFGKVMPIRRVREDAQNGVWGCGHWRQVMSTKRWGSCRPLTEMLRVLTDLPVGSRGLSDENLPTSICLLHCATITIFAFVETKFPVVWATLELFFLFN
jgi:hypothetical protein